MMKRFIGLEGEVVGETWRERTGALTNWTIINTGAKNDVVRILGNCLIFGAGPLFSSFAACLLFAC